jgi:hypothetical protein
METDFGHKHVVADLRACPSEGVNELSGEHIPLLEEEVWMRGQKNIAKQP